MKRQRAAVLLAVAMLAIFPAAIAARPESSPRAIAPGDEIRSYGAAGPAEARVSRGQRGGGAGERDYTIRIHKPAGTAVGKPAEGRIVEGEAVANGRDATGPVLMVMRGVAFARGWRPIVRTPRTTVVAPGSCIAVEIDGDAERIYLIESDAAQVWLNTDPADVVNLGPRQFVKVTGDPATPSFVREASGAVALFSIENDEAGRRFVRNYPDDATR